MKLVVGCPVKDRGWVLPHWFLHFNEALSFVSLPVEAEFLFVAPENDRSLEGCLVGDPVSSTGSRTEWAGGSVIWCPAEAPYRRLWNNANLERMTGLRNRLLEGVREAAPDFFLSLDSDILLHPQSLNSMVQFLVDNPEVDAVGGKTFMSQHGTTFPSMGYWKDAQRKRFTRPADAGGDCRKVDVLMAIKLMRPSAYNVDYSFDSLGEDIGWSRNAAEQRLTFYWDGRHTSKHVMEPEFLEVKDKRCGF